MDHGEEGTVRGPCGREGRGGGAGAGAGMALDGGDFGGHFGESTSDVSPGRGKGFVGFEARRRHRG